MTSNRVPTLYFDSLAGLVALRRSRTSVNANGTVTSVVARDRGAYRAGDTIEFLWTALVFKSNVRDGKQLVIPACAHVAGTSVYTIAREKYAERVEVRP